MPATKGRIPERMIIRTATGSNDQDFSAETIDKVTESQKPTFWVTRLIAPGIFVDVLDLIVLGALIPDIVAKLQFTTPRGRLRRKHNARSPFHRLVRTGQFTDRLGTGRARSSIFCCSVSSPFSGALAPGPVLASGVSFHCRDLGLGAEQPLCWAYCQRIRAQGHSRPDPRDHPVLRRRTASRRSRFCFRCCFRDTLGWRGMWIGIGIVRSSVLLPLSLPESPRWLTTHGKGDKALDVLKPWGCRGRRSRSRPTPPATPRAIRSW